MGSSKGWGAMHFAASHVQGDALAAAGLPARTAPPYQRRAACAQPFCDGFNVCACLWCSAARPPPPHTQPAARPTTTRCYSSTPVHRTSVRVRCSLRYLSLASAGVEDAGAGALLRALRANTSLVELDFADNYAHESILGPLHPRVRCAD